MRLRDDLDGLHALIGGIARTTRIPAVHVEKDFWLTEALRGMAAYATAQDFTVLFKGGTSLSKAFRLIERFSEDVDVLVVLPAGGGRARDRFLKGLVRAAEDATSLTAAVDPSTVTTGVKRSARLTYPTAALGPGGLSAGVLLEMGSRGGVLPYQRRTIRSLVAEHTTEDLSEYEEAQAFEVPVLSPARTLVEKLVLLHTAHVSGDRDRVIKTARHYYDVHQLLQDHGVCAELRSLRTDAMARDVLTYSRDANLPALPRPAGGFAASPAFGGQAALLTDAQRSYERIIDQLVWPQAARPAFAACLAAVRTSATLL